MKVVVIDYGLGNMRSVIGAVNRLGYEAIASGKADDVRSADKLILPGVGAFGDGMKNLRGLGLVEQLNESVLKAGVPILGICLGSQLMAKESYEFGHNTGLGWFDASVVRLEPKDASLRVPHVGWNCMIKTKDDPVFDGIPEDALFYYTHSFYLRFNDKSAIIGECEYGMRFGSVFRKGNIYASQFHPEKSQRYGLVFLNNFLSKAG